MFSSVFRSREQGTHGLFPKSFRSCTAHALRQKVFFRLGHIFLGLSVLIDQFNLDFRHMCCTA